MPRVDIVIPVYNEEKALPGAVRRLRRYLEEGFPYPWRILIADNGSTDATGEVALSLVREDPERVAYLRIPEKGRGRALRRAWLASTAEVAVYMDVDLSTDLSALPALVDAILKEGNDLAVGSRLLPGSRTRRSLKREVVSRTYNLLRRALFPSSRVRDAQCGFKAIRRECAQALLPQIQDNHWFFDTELLIRAEQQGYRVKEIPVTWQEDPTTTVRLARDAWAMFRGLLRVRFHPASPGRRPRPRP